MFRIKHGDALRLENLVRRLFECDRTGVSRLADADHFESRPMDAAIVVIAYIHAKKLQDSETQYDEFLSKYDTIFTYPDENNAQDEVQNYIDDLAKIVEKYV